MKAKREREGAEMSEMFASYEREFGELSASIRKKTNAVIGGAAGKRAKIAEVDADIAEADALVRGNCVLGSGEKRKRNSPFSSL